MRLSVSNIAWDADVDDSVAALLLARGVSSLEVAPTKGLGDLAAATEKDASRYRRRWTAAGFDIVACQSLLFGRPQLAVFEGEGTSAETEQYLSQVVRLCAALGAGPLVFGSPRNRSRGERSVEEASAAASGFFRRLGDVALSGGSCLCIEANPPRYGADFLTTAAEAAAFVRRVNHPGVRLHLDAACMALTGDDVEAAIADSADLLAHVHISEPDLGPVGAGEHFVDHDAVASALRRAGYAGFVSIEMRPTDDPVASVAAAVDFATETYLA